MDKILRAALYIRVSTAEQAMHGKSLQAQRECLESYAAANNMVVVGLYADEGQTARKELKKRKEIHRLIKDVEAGLIDIILFWKMDRWFRNVSDFYKVQDILDTYHVTWRAIAEPNMNLDTRDGRLNLNIMLSIGQNEVDTTSERIKFTVNNMIDNGRLVWGEKNIGFGYRIVDGRIEKDPETEHIVIDAYKYLMKCRSKRRTVQYIQDTYHIDFSYTMLRTMCTSEFYIGKYRDNDHYCPAYLTMEEWQVIQDINRSNVKTARSGRSYYFAGLMRCPECGCKLASTGSSSIINRKTREKKHYCYYKCNKHALDNRCNNGYCYSQNLIEEYLLQNLADEYRKFIGAITKVQGKVEPTVKKRTKSAIIEERNRVNMLFQKGRIDYDYYEKEYEKLSKELSELEEVVKPVVSYAHIERLLQGDFRKMYDKLDEPAKQAFWQSLIDYIELEGREIRAVYFK